MTMPIRQSARQLFNRSGFSEVVIDETMAAAIDTH